ncbi:MAG: DEAD/DEAH box helicase [Halobacteriovoraceae bacterium]|nr:DEAD/DEAH box helicase [Halobacteriovoraceae bacterium]
MFKKILKDIIIETTIEFSSFEMDKTLLTTLDENSFKKASPIQDMTYKPIIAGKDIFAQAETGSGKTGAFVIPILEKMLRATVPDQSETNECLYAVLSPTRELAQQTHKVFKMFGENIGVKSVCVIGGENIDTQKEIIGKGVHVVVATPGRLVDLIKQKVVSLSNVKGLVFDEADRLFDMGFKKDIEFVLGRSNKNRQLIMLSATTNMEVLSTAYKFGSVPEEFKLNEDSLLVDHIDHKVAMLSSDEKFSLLVQILRNKQDAHTIVFCNTQVQTHTVAEWLNLMGIVAKPISGKLAQNRRTKLLEEFRSKKIGVLVCTDVAARGLDIKDVNLVVNYDLPQEASNYVHRIGRTGRAGSSGEAISFCAYEDSENIEAIYELIEEKIEKLDLSNDDFATDICAKPRIDRRTLKVQTNDRNSSYEKRDNKRTKTPPRQPVQRRERVKREDRPKLPRVDKRFYETESYSLKEASVMAMSFLRITDESLLGHEVLSAGKRKFFIFGSKLTKYKFFIKPIYKKLLLPFMIETIKKAQLNLYVRVSFKNNTLLVSFSGKDEALLVKNNFELIDAFEQIITVYLQSRVMMHRGIKINVKCFKARANNKPSRNNGNDEEKMAKFAKKMKQKVLESDDVIKLKPLNGRDRRLIHKFFEEDGTITSTSIGDGAYKVIELRQK